MSGVGKEAETVKEGGVQEGGVQEGERKGG
jgi:hypothetical protein